MPRKVQDFEHINMEVATIRRLDAWIREINSGPLTSHQIASKRREIIDTFIREECSVAGMESNLWPGLRCGQLLAEAAERIAQAHRNTKALEVVVTILQKHVVELEQELEQERAERS